MRALKSILIIVLICLATNCKTILTHADTDFSDNKAVGNVIDNFVKSEVYLTYNEYDETKSFKTNIKIIVKTNGEVQEILTNNLCGYNPKMFLGDFLGDGLNQIMLTVNNEIGEPLVIIYAFINGEIKPIFNYDDFNLNNKISLNMRNELLDINLNDSSFLIDYKGSDKLDFDVIKYKIYPYFNDEQNKYNLLVVNKLNINLNTNFYFASFVELTNSENKILKLGLVK